MVEKGTTPVEKQSRARGVDISQEDQYGGLQGQFGFGDHTLALCCLANQNAWDNIEKSVIRSELFIKIMQDPKEVFTNFLQFLASARNIILSDPEIRQILIECLAFQNIRMQNVIRPLETRSALNLMLMILLSWEKLFKNF